MPFMDHRLIEFCLKIPACYKIHNGYTKYFARLAFDGKLPDAITWRKDKMGFPVPENYWLNGVLKNWVNTTVNDSKLLKLMPNSLNNNFEKLTRSLNIALWEKLFWAETVMDKYQKVYYKLLK
jgi:asparagine synthase (glutamine-hydrolysing)